MTDNAYTDYGHEFCHVLAFRRGDRSGDIEHADNCYPGEWPIWWLL